MQILSNCQPFLYASQHILKQFFCHYIYTLIQSSVFKISEKSRVVSNGVCLLEQYFFFLIAVLLLLNAWAEEGQFRYFSQSHQELVLVKRNLVQFRSMYVLLLPSSTTSPTKTFAIPETAITTFCETEHPVIDCINY